MIRVGKMCKGDTTYVDSSLKIELLHEHCVKQVLI